MRNKNSSSEPRTVNGLPPPTDVYDTFYADAYDGLFGRTEKIAAEIGLVESLLPEPERRSYSVLDIACGTGNHAALLSQRYAVTGLDASPDMLRVASAKVPGARFVCGDLREPSLFKRGGFDVATSFYDGCFYSPEWRVALRNAALWVRRNGFFVLSWLDRRKLQTLTSETASVCDAVPFSQGLYRGAWRLLEGEEVAYCETFTVNGRTLTREHRMFLPPEEELLDAAKANGFALIDRVSLSSVDEDDEAVFVLRKAVP
ncbi:MAG: class I SAM-dependent methyltransferase [Myxococcota bacterium]